MNAKKDLIELASVVEQTRRSVKFCSSGELSVKRPGLAIDSVGEVKLPIRLKSAKELIAVCHDAPYGKGTKTIVDKKVRNTLEIGPRKLTLSDAWNDAVQSAVDEVAQDLGLPAERLQARLYKLLVYQKGGFFLPHRDSEKSKRMVASMIVMLPSSFDGGELVINHANSRRTYSFGRASAGEAAEYVAFYADCQHEVRKVTRGVRVCLAYNLVLQAAKTSENTPATRPQSSDALTAAVQGWLHSRPRDPIVFALEHQYTSAGLKLDLLKGNDRQIAQSIVESAQATECRVHFGQVSRHLMQFADDGSFGRERHWRYRKVDTSELELGEVYEDEIIVDGWKDVRGKRAKIGALPLESSMLVSSLPVDQWKPTSEDFEGYTGNAGNTLDRWYHKSAIVLWSDDHHFDVIARTGTQKSIELFLSMRSKLIKTPESRLEQACTDCEALARAIVKHWPERSHRRSGKQKEDQPWLVEFTNELPELEDPDLVGEFLRVVSNRDWILRLDKLVIACCRRFGGETMCPVLIQHLLTLPEPNRYGVRRGEGLPSRDAVWLNKLTCDRKQGGMESDQLNDLCQIAADRFCDHVTETQTRYRSPTDETGQTMVLLLKASMAANCETVSGQLIDLIRECPEVFDLRSFQVQAVNDIAQWTAKRPTGRPAMINHWITEVREALLASTKREPSPPKDFARRADLSCSCEYCNQLAKFLEDPDAETSRISAREDRRDHLEHTIHSNQLDVSPSLDRSSRPYALSLKKTTTSYERSLQQYHADLKLLESLQDD